jgi:basic amino acid/polyamine antiporter, APA family
MSANKMGIWAVISLVISAQLGSAIFTLPTSLAPLGSISIFGWLISGTGAILLALVFSYLCINMPKSGGPHAYVQAAFGEIPAFYTSWVYWLISWISSTVVIIAATEFLLHLLGDHGKFFNLFIEILILTIFTLINIRSMLLVGVFELILTILKCLPLIIIPIGGLFMLEKENFLPFNATNFSDFEVLNQASIITFWGFIGLESATATTGVINNPAKIVPRAVVIGTVFVAIISMLNSIGIMAIIPADQLAHEMAPYARACYLLFGGISDKLMAIIGLIACLGTLNAWILTSGQIALGASQDKLLPEIFGRTNKNNIPYMSIILSYLGTIVLLLFTLDDNLALQLKLFVDFSVTAFLFVYLACMLAFLKLKIGSKKQIAISLAALLFCLWAISATSWGNKLITFGVIASGVPLYYFNKKHKL